MAQLLLYDKPDRCRYFAGHLSQDAAGGSKIWGPQERIGHEGQGGASIIPLGNNAE